MLLIRKEDYTGWTKILGPDGNTNDAKILCDFATKHNIQGYDICNFGPDEVCIHYLLINHTP